jgi:Fic family protein
VHRLRNWFEENSVPLDIVSNRDGYRLLATAPYTLELASHVASGSTSNPSQFERLQAYLKANNAEDFTAREIAAALDTSERSARYFLKWAVENSLLTRTGSGRQIRYRL